MITAGSDTINAPGLQPAGGIAPELTVLVPVYRSAPMLPLLYQRLTAVLDGMQKSFEIVFIEDCGGDDSWQVIEGLNASDPRVRGLRMSRNYGQHNALLCGIRAARGRLIVTLDDDLQNPPEEIPKLLAALEQGYDVVYGAPRQERHGLLRDMASRVTKLALQNAMGAQTASKISAFRVFRTRLREAFSNYRSPTVNIDVLLTWASTRFTSVTVNHDLREMGESGYTMGKLMTHALNMMTGFSTLPLRIATLLGFTFAVFGFVVLAYVLVIYFMVGTSAPGFPFLASITAIFSGVQLFSLGIIGEYLARMHFRTMERPPFSVRESVGLGLQE